MPKITKVSRNGVLYGKVGRGDEITDFSGREFVDILDYIYADSLDEGTVTAVSNGNKTVINYKKEYDDDTLGLEFDDSVAIKPRVCRNNCIFCFVQQLPKGLRDTLYIKDDDYRLSFVSGSYITCTNLSEKDIDRILEYRLSPLYVSVHATDEETRKKILGVVKAPEQMPILKRFVGGGITIHAQIVLVAGINDGEILKKSLCDLYSVGIKTVAIVPVGLTGYREGKYKISPLNASQAGSAIDITESFYNLHAGFCYCSDEMYQIAGRKIPGAEYYGAYEQIENGVGLIAKFEAELVSALAAAPKKVRAGKVGLFTGVSGYPTMERAKNLIESAYPNIKINIYTVENDFFGRTVVVTGLVTATDIIKQYGGKKFEEDFLMIPNVMLKEFETVFLDDISVKQLSRKLRKKIKITRCTGESYLNTVIRGR
jgi:putative radical SAM enzyme (TIGR03279 family)